MMTTILPSSSQIEHQLQCLPLSGPVAAAGDDAGCHVLRPAAVSEAANEAALVFCGVPPVSADVVVAAVGAGAVAAVGAGAVAVADTGRLQLRGGDAVRPQWQ